MAKLSRTALKGIVKECLIEILNEGISGDGDLKISSLTESSTRHRSNRPDSNTINRSARIGSSRSNTQSRHRLSLDSVTYGNQPGHASNEKFENNVNNAVSNLTSDPILSSIFQDTARTTLQEQRSAKVSDSGMMSHDAAVLAQGDSAARAVFQSDPMEMFSGASEKWAQLAFSSHDSK